ncbi:hypothetical protein [Caballeronia sp. LZ019]|uniref:hypothetical protein n=1 Tax=Caballeronia sp. LZ019 TaxID=3038555 RepID=UPI002858E9A8|nr:hypothetical protein [Caballeronia sp. LZ019]MDR5810838.1 hypothetical protein [Caballeronia sp. LZ019]
MRFSNRAEDWLAAQRDNHAQQRWLESIALGRAVLKRADLSNEQSEESSTMLCEASLELNEAALTADTFAACLHHVKRLETIDRLLERFCQLCTADQARPVFALQKWSAYEFNHLSVNVYNRQRFDHAEALVSQWRHRWPDEREANASRLLGWIKWRQLKYQEGLDAFDRSLSLEHNAESLIGRAFILSFMSRFSESIQLLEELSKTIYINGSGCRVYANSLFGAGRVRESMELYERRLRDTDFLACSPTGIPEWNGAPLDGRLLVLLDVGWSFGDFLMYLRYLTLVQSRVASVRVQVPDRLERVLRASFPTLEIRSDEPTITEGCDAYVWLMSLPVRLQLWLTAPETLPWLRASEAAQQEWADWLPAQYGETGGPDGKRKRIGLCWRGNPHTYHDRLRSGSLDDFTPLFEALTDVDWVNLQLEASERPPEALLASRNSRWCDPMPRVHDFEDTVAIAQGLDRIVTVDSAVAHVCASAGVPTTLLVPIWGEWRWQTGNTSPWYPDVELLRTPPGSTFRHTLQRLVDDKRANW